MEGEPQPPQQQLRLRQRVKGGGGRTAPISTDSDEDSQAHQLDDADALVPPARSAFDGVFAGCDVSSTGGAAGSAVDVPGPPCQSMDDDDEAGAANRDAPDAPSGSGPSSVAIPGSRLTLPPHLRALMEQRRAELLAQHPDIMTRELAEEADPGSGSLWSLCPRVDVWVVAALLALLCYLLYSEYQIDVPGWIGRRMRAMLDPGPIQRATTSHAGTGTAEQGDGDFAQGRAAMAAALKAAREGIARQRQQ